MSIWLASMLAGALVGGADALRLLLAGQGGSSALALAYGVLLGAGLGGISLSAQGLVQRLAPRARGTTRWGLAALTWSWVCWTLVGGHGVASSSWRWPIFVALVALGGIGLWVLLVAGRRAQDQALRSRFVARVALGLVVVVGYGSGWLYRESYVELHLFALAVALLVSAALLGPLAQRWDGRGLRIGAALALVAMGITAFVGSGPAHKAALYHRTEAARSLIVAKSLWGSASSSRDRLDSLAANVKLEPLYRVPACTELPTEAPDIVLLSVDALRADNLFEQEPVVMPHLEALSKDGTVFTSAYAPSPATSTSLLPMLTGLSALAIRSQGRLPGNLASELQGLGYHTVSYESFSGVSRRLLPKVHATKMGFDQLMHTKGSEAIGAEIAETIRARSEGKPLFFYAHLPEPHAHYQRHAEFDFGASSRGRYTSEVAFVDAQLGALLDALRDMGRLDQTLLIVTADHGEAFFEHGVMAHGTTVYEEMVEVPLVFWSAKHRAGRIDDPVSLVDLAPTVMAAIGCGLSYESEGESLLRNGELRAWRAAVVTRQYDTEASGARFVERSAVRLGRHKLIVDLRRDLQELYDLEADPSESRNLIGSVDESELLAALAIDRRRIAELGMAAATDEGARLSVALEAGDEAAVHSALRRLEAVRKLGDADRRLIDSLAAMESSSARSGLWRLYRRSDEEPELRRALALALAEQPSFLSRSLPWLVFTDIEAAPAERRRALRLLDDALWPDARRLEDYAFRTRHMTLAVAASNRLCELEGYEGKAARLLRAKMSAPQRLPSLEREDALAAMHCLARAGDEGDIRFLMTLYSEHISKKAKLAYENIAILGGTGHPDVLPLLEKESRSGYEPVRLAALDALVAHGSPEARRILVNRALTHRHLVEAQEHYVALMESLFGAPTPIEVSALSTALDQASDDDLLMLELRADAVDRVLQVGANKQVRVPSSKSNPRIFVHRSARPLTLTWADELPAQIEKAWLLSR